MSAGPFDQAGFRLVLDWGRPGLARLAPRAGAVVVVDVLRFTTCVDVVVAGSGRVRPVAGPGDGAALSPVAAATAAAGTAGASPEALAAVAAFEAAALALPALLRECGSGRELAARGFVADVAMAADLDVSTAVPVLRAGAFVPLQ